MGNDLNIYFALSTNRVGYESDNDSTNIVLRAGHFASIIGSNENTDCIGILDTEDLVYTIKSNTVVNTSSLDLAAIVFDFE